MMLLIIITAAISIVLYLTNKGENTAFYKINKKMYKTYKKKKKKKSEHSTVFLVIINNKEDF